MCRFVLLPVCVLEDAWLVVASHTVQAGVLHAVPEKPGWFLCFTAHSALVKVGGPHTSQLGHLLDRRHVEQRHRVQWLRIFQREGQVDVVRMGHCLC